MAISLRVNTPGIQIKKVIDMETSKLLKEHDICIFYKQNIFFPLQFIEKREDTFVFMPIKESLNYFKEELLLTQDIVDTQVFRQNNYQYWPDEIVQEYAQYQIKRINNTSKKLQTVSNLVYDKLDKLMQSDSYEVIQKTNKQLAETIEKLKNTFKSNEKVDEQD